MSAKQTSRNYYTIFWYGGYPNSIALGQMCLHTQRLESVRSLAPETPDTTHSDRSRKLADYDNPGSRMLIKVFAESSHVGPPLMAEAIALASMAASSIWRHAACK